MRIGKLLWITAGAAVAALALHLFLVPNRIAPGGVSGLATVLHHVLGVPVGVVIILINLPLLLWAWKSMGREYALYSLYGFGMLGLLADVVTLPAATEDLFLAALYGGLLMGTGLGMVLRAGGNTGGTDLVAAVVRVKKPYIPMGGLIFGVDAGVVAIGLAIFGMEITMYAMLALYASSKMIDLVMEGISSGKAVYVISEEHACIARRVMEEMARGATEWNAMGMYTRQEKGVLLCLLKNSREVVTLKQIVRQTDRRAFVFVSNVKEVLGEGFSEMGDESANHRAADKEQRTN